MGGQAPQRASHTQHSTRRVTAPYGPQSSPHLATGRGPAWEGGVTQHSGMNSGEKGKKRKRCSLSRGGDTWDRAGGLRNSTD